MKIAKLYLKDSAKGFLKMLPYEEACHINIQDKVIKGKEIFSVIDKVHDFDSNELTIILETL